MQYTEKNWFQKLFINEAKAALEHHSSSGGLISISTEADMDAILANATEDDVGKYYVYTGETTDKYESGALYKIEQE